MSIDDVEQTQILHPYSQKGEFGVTRSSPDTSGNTPTLAVDGGDLSPSARYVMGQNSQRNSDDDQPRGDLLRCEVASRTCVVTVPDLDFSDTQVPLGAHIGD